jgi:endonuclease YncB( thermonuclease family)
MRPKARFILWTSTIALGSLGAAAVVATLDPEPVETAVAVVRLPSVEPAAPPIDAPAATPTPAAAPPPTAAPVVADAAPAASPSVAKSPVAAPPPPPPMPAKAAVVAAPVEPRVSPATDAAAAVPPAVVPPSPPAIAVPTATPAPPPPPAMPSATIAAAASGGPPVDGGTVAPTTTETMVVEPPPSAPPVRSTAVTATAEPVGVRRLAPVVVEDAATISAGPIRVRLPGVVALGLDETCRAADGRDWPCGRRALAAIRGHVRGRAVECPLPKTARTGEFTGACTIGGIDLGRWAIENGWARAAADDPEASAAMARAQTAERGIHATTAPPALRAEAEPITGAVPPDRTTAPLPDAGGEARPSPAPPVPVIARPSLSPAAPPLPVAPPTVAPPAPGAGLEPMRLLP